MNRNAPYVVGGYLFDEPRNIESVKKLDLACYSAVQQFIAKEKPDLSAEQIFIIDSTKVLLGSTHKGFYYSVTARAKNNFVLDSFFRAAKILSIKGL